MSRYPYSSRVCPVCAPVSSTWVVTLRTSCPAGFGVLTPWSEGRDPTVGPNSWYTVPPKSPKLSTPRATAPWDHCCPLVPPRPVDRDPYSLPRRVRESRGSTQRVRESPHPTFLRLRSQGVLVSGGICSIYPRCVFNTP